MVRLGRNRLIPLPMPLGYSSLAICPCTCFPALFGPGTTEFDDRINGGSKAYNPESRRVLQCGDLFLASRIILRPLF
jgi:hypothetical protein